MLAGGHPPVPAELEEQLAGRIAVAAAVRRPAPSVAGAASSDRRAARPPATGAARTSTRRASRSRSAIRDPGTSDVAGRRRAPGRRDEAGIGPRSGRSTTVRRGRRRLEAAGRSSVAGDPQRVLPGLEQLPPPLGAVRQPERDVAQVEQQAAEPAGDVDGEPPATAAEPDRVAELELGRRAARRAAGRPARGRRGSARARSSRPRRGRSTRPALRPGPDAARDDDARRAARGGRRRCRRSAGGAPCASGIEPSGREEPGVVVGDADRRRAADDVGDREGDRPGPGRPPTRRRPRR